LGKKEKTMSRVFFPAASFSRSKASLEKKKRKKKRKKLCFFFDAPFFFHFALEKKSKT
jgi:hypothetical protein